MRYADPNPIDNRGNRESRFSPTPLGFIRFRARGGFRLAKSSWRKWRPIILQIESLCTDLFDDRSWGEIDPEEIAYTLIPQLYARCRNKKGGKAATNTLRGRYDAANAYFDFLIKTRHLAQSPCEFQRRPSSKANLRPFLEPSEDENSLAQRSAGCKPSQPTWSDL